MHIVIEKTFINLCVYIRVPVADQIGYRPAMTTVFISSACLLTFPLLRLHLPVTKGQLVTWGALKNLISSCKPCTTAVSLIGKGILFFKKTPKITKPHFLCCSFLLAHGISSTSILCTRNMLQSSASYLPFPTTMCWNKICCRVGERDFADF